MNRRDFLFNAALASGGAALRLDRQEGTCDKPTLEGFLGLNFLFILLDMAVACFPLEDLFFVSFRFHLDRTISASTSFRKL